MSNSISIIASLVLYKHDYTELKETLDSLLAINAIKKIILVDNDSSDWAIDYAKHNDRIEYIKSTRNLGFGYGHNQAIKLYAKKCDYFLICNPDIVFDTTQFNNFFEFVLTREEGLFLPKIVYENGENQYGARLLPSPLNLFSRRFSPRLAAKLDESYLLKRFEITKDIFVPYLSGCFMLFDSDKLLALNGFDERFFMYMEDIDISRRCAEKFGAIYYPLAKVIHKHEQGSYKNPALLKAHLKSAFDYFNKWGWVYDRGRSSLNKKCLNQF